MQKPLELVSPKQVARAIGVSESSLKRWCDQGRIKTVRTVGGHRKLAVPDVLRFVREHAHPLRSPELLGLPPCSGHAPSGLARGASEFASALLAGDEARARQVVFDLYLAKHPLSVLCDEVFARAFQAIGERWACREAEVYQERRGCAIALRILEDLRRVQPPPGAGPRGMGGALEGDHYALPTAMAELVLRDAGFRATSLGTSIPADSLARAVRDARPDVFWLSVSHVGAEADFVARFATLSAACAEAGAALVVGGRALTDGLRQRMTFAAYGDTMRHLAAFAGAWPRASAPRRHGPS